MKRTVISTLAYAVRISKLDDRPDLRDHGDEIIRSIEDNYLPHGSGIDHGTVLDRDRSTPEKLIFILDFHAMDGNGSYAGWSTFEVSAEPSFETDISLHITGTDVEIFGPCDCVKEHECETPGEECYCDDVHGESCIEGNDDGIMEMLIEDMSYSLSRELTDEEHIALSDLKSHLRRASA